MGSPHDGDAAGDVLAVRFDAEEVDARCEGAGAHVQVARQPRTGRRRSRDEHGVGLDKREYMELIFTDAAMSMMCDVRRVFDPSGRANPAKILPTRAVPCFWIAKSAMRAMTVSGTIHLSRTGVATPMPSNALNIVIAPA